MASGATVLELPFGGLTTTQTPSIKGEKWIFVRNGNGMECYYCYCYCYYYYYYYYYCHCCCCYYYTIVSNIICNQCQYQ